MDQTQQVVAVIIVAAVGVAATLAILRRQRHERERPPESPFGTSTEGEKRCPKCGMGNLVTSAQCVSCGARLPG